MEIKFMIDIKTIRKAFAIMDIDIPSDEEIIEKLTTVVVDLTKSEDPEYQQAVLGFALLTVGEGFLTVK